MLISSDWHYRDESADTVINEVIPGVVEACKKHNDTEAVCLGDVFHFRYKVDVRLFNMLRDAIRDTVDQGLVWRFLPGNHDQYNVSGRNILESLGDLDGVTVYSDPTWDSDGLWIPYRKRNEDIAAALRTHSSRGGPNVCFMHHGVAGSWMNDHIQNTEGLPVTEFKKFKYVFSGHYHRHHSVGPVTYIGSPYQTTAAESGHQKGYYLWNGRGGLFRPTNWGKKYHRFTIEDAEGLNFAGIDPRDEVRVRTVSGVDPEVVGKALVQAGITNSVVTPDVEQLQARLAVPENADLGMFAQAYVDAQDTPLDKAKLMNVFKEIRG